MKEVSKMICSHLEGIVARAQTRQKLTPGNQLETFLSPEYLEAGWPRQES
jgi:hypothetical protein